MKKNFSSQRIIRLAEENAFLLEEVMDRYWQVCREYAGFIRTNRDHFDSSEVGFSLRNKNNGTIYFIVFVSKGDFILQPRLEHNC